MVDSIALWRQVRPLLVVWSGMVQSFISRAQLHDEIKLQTCSPSILSVDLLRVHMDIGCRRIVLPIDSEGVSDTIWTFHSVKACVKKFPRAS